MIKMSYDKFEEICEKMDELPNIIDNNKGLTEHDLEIIQTKIVKDYPDKAVLKAMYYLSRDYPDDHIFSNKDAIPASELKIEFNNLIKELVEFTDD